LNTSNVTNITQTTATGGGEVYDDGGSPVTARGICYNVAENPTIANSVVASGSGLGSFSANLTSLTAGNTYYIRAYATNTAGTTYGNQVSFTTLGSVTLATIVTTLPSSITGLSVVSGGYITGDGGAPVTSRGVCWKTSPGPTTANSKTTNGTGTGSFISNVTGLSPNTTYYLRAYAINSVGSTYGDEVNFTTLEGNINIATSIITNVTPTSVTTGGLISGDGCVPVTERGVCWKTSPNPTIENSHTHDGSGLCSYTSNLTGLIPSTTYYIRSYATNMAGTNYGNQVITTTTSGIPTLTTEVISNPTFHSATSGGTILNDGGTPVTARGVCWHTSPNPTIANNHTTDGAGAGSFSSNLTGLTLNTLYYVRAYATNNIIGTAYGNELSFSTHGPISGSGVIDIDGNIYTTKILGTQEIMVGNLKTTKYANGDNIPNKSDDDEWYNSYFEGAWCWYNNNIVYENPYGKLYNWIAVTDSRKLCPTGWHVPTDAEWTVLTAYMGDEDVVGGYMKEVGTAHWIPPNTSATNESSFTGLPGGERSLYGPFDNLGYEGTWWSATEANEQSAWLRQLFYDHGEVFRNGINKKQGYSVRCFKN
jgi:uncharacterized protein (TIGR02145 family)